MKVLVVAGWSGSGKTTLMTGMIGVCMARGLQVSTVKHAHHEVELDRPGKDSYRHREAGAAEVILASGGRFALYGGHRGAGAAALPALEVLLGRLRPVDLVLVEGFKGAAFPTLEVFRPALGQPPLWREMPVLAVASDGAVSGCPAPVLDLNAVDEVTAFVLARLGVTYGGSA